MWKQALLILGLMMWGLVTFACILATYHMHSLNQELRAQVELLRDIRRVEGEMCVGTHQVNQVCEQTVAQFAEQLGLDVSPAPILTISISNRYWQRWAAANGWGGIGGGTEEDEQVP